MFEDLAQKRASQITLKECSKEVRKESGYTGVLLTKKNYVDEHQKIIGIIRWHSIKDAVKDPSLSLQWLGLLGLILGLGTST